MIYYILEIIIYVIITLGIGLYIGYIIDRTHKEAERVVIAHRSILKDLTRIAELVEEHNRLLTKIIERREDDIKRRYEDVRK